MLSLIQSNKVLKFALVLCLCLCLLFVGSFRANAVATAVGVVAAVALLCLAAWGVSTYATDMTQAGVSDYMQGEVDEWATAAGVSLASVEAGIGQTALGQVVLNPFAAKAMRLFAGWYVQQNGIEAGGESVEVVSSGLSFNGVPVVPFGSAQYSFPQSANGQKLEITCSGCWGFWYLQSANNALNFGAVSEMNGAYATVNIINTPSNSSRTVRVDLTSTQNGVYYANVYSIASVYENIMVSPDPIPYDLSTVLGGTGGFAEGDGSLEMIPSDVIGIPAEEDLENKDVILDFNGLSGLDWVQSIDQILGDVVSNDIDVTSQIVEEGAITTTDDVAQQPIVEGADGIDWPDITRPVGVSGFDDVFPFCLPFDVAHFFEALAADPVAPKFEVPFQIPDLIDYTFEIDLEAFDQAAQIFRTMELFAFIVGLAFVTRNFFIRG